MMSRDSERSSRAPPPMRLKPDISKTAADAI